MIAASILFRPTTREPRGEPHGPDGVQQRSRFEEHEATRARLDVVDADGGVALAEELLADQRKRGAPPLAPGGTVEVQEQRHLAVVLAGGTGVWTRCPGGRHTHPV